MCGCLWVCVCRCVSVGVSVCVGVCLWAYVSVGVCEGIGCVRAHLCVCLQTDEMRGEEHRQVTAFFRALHHLYVRTEEMQRKMNGRILLLE